VKIANIICLRRKNLGGRVRKNAIELNNSKISQKHGTQINFLIIIIKCIQINQEKVESCNYLSLIENLEKNH
jgi:hypothetical protein